LPSNPLITSTNPHGLVVTQAAIARAAHRPANADEAVVCAAESHARNVIPGVLAARIGHPREPAHAYTQ
jgi:hypothetical protein